MEPSDLPELVLILIYIFMLFKGSEYRNVQ